MGLVLLGLLAAGSAGAAMLRYRDASAEPALPPTSSTPVAVPSATPSVTASAPVAVGPTQPAIPAVATVVVIGDSHSVGEPSENWVGPVTAGLGWGEVTNLSSPGRGFVQPPRNCSFDVCATLQGSVPLIAGYAPDVVVTFAGAADGDQSLEAAAEQYFADLREALPDATLVAVLPVTGKDEVPDWLTRNRLAITAAVEGVGGRVVDVGQPGLGDGNTLSAETQAQIAGGIVERLSA